MLQFMYAGENKIGDIGANKICQKQWAKLSVLWLSKYWLSKMEIKLMANN